LFFDFHWLAFFKVSLVNQAFTSPDLLDSGFIDYRHNFAALPIRVAVDSG